MQGNKEGRCQNNAIVECIDYIPDTNSWHYALQLNIYRKIPENKYDKEVDELWLISLHPENKGGMHIKIKVPILEEDISRLFDYRKDEICN